jgi:alkylated DNA repair dioxygenase AlkB
VDTHSCFDAPIVAISVGSPVVMEFRRANAKYSVVVPPRSLLVMDGSARLVCFFLKVQAKNSSATRCYKMFE